MKAIPSVTPAQMARIDEIMEKKLHISVLQMMENDGRVIANLACNVYNFPRRVTVLVGKGNNGGGGLAAARHMYNKGIEVSVVLADKDLKEVPAKQFRAVKAFGIKVERDLKGRPDLIVDALLGYSGRGPPHGRVAELIMQAQNIDVPVLCNDVPSGLDLSTGQWFSPAFKDADVVTLGLPKKFMIGNTGIRRIFLADIGIPREAYSRIGVKVPLLFGERDYIDLSAQHALGI
jgi:NAD(P)H-hydrate epimerase